MSRPGWRLDEASEEAHLYPWLAAEPDPKLREEALRFLATLVRAPLGRGEESEYGVYSTVIKGRVTLIWTLDLERHVVVLVWIRSHA